MPDGGMISATGIARTRVRIKGTSLYVKTYGRGSEPAYDGQSSGRRVRNWNPSSASANTLLGGVQSQRNRSRDLVRKVPWVTSGVETLVSNIVGEGIRPLPQTESAPFRAAAGALWKTWCDEADADGINDLYGIQSLAVRTMVEAGECFIRMRERRTSDGLTVPLQLQALEPEFVPVEKNEILSNGNVIKCGIEFDKLGRRVAYHMYRQHPGEVSLTGTASLFQTTRVPAGQVIHLFDRRRPGQVRGMPWLSPVMIRTRDLLEYEDSELVRKKTAAMFTAFVTRPDPEDALLNEDEDDVDSADEEGVAVTSLEPGTVQLLEPGEEVQFASPADVGGSYEPFLKMQLRAIAAGLGVTYEQLTGDLADVNFSSIRAGLLEFKRRVRRIQGLVVFQFCRIVWKAFMDTAVMVGVLDARGYGTQPAKYLAVEWVPPGWDFVNPKDEEEAYRRMVRDGFRSRRKVAAMLGEDVAEVDRQIAEDQARAAELGLVLDTDPSQTALNGQARGAKESAGAGDGSSAESEGAPA